VARGDWLRDVADAASGNTVSGDDACPLLRRWRWEKGGQDGNGAGGPAHALAAGAPVENHLALYKAVRESPASVRAEADHVFFFSTANVAHVKATYVVVRYTIARG